MTSKAIEAARQAWFRVTYGTGNRPCGSADEAMRAAILAFLENADSDAVADIIARAAVSMATDEGTTHAVLSHLKEQCRD